jgi:hypothetical protein
MKKPPEKIKTPEQFEFFDQYMRENRIPDKTLASEGWVEAGIQYPVITFVPLIIGIVCALYLGYVWLGAAPDLNNQFFSLSSSFERSAWLVSMVNAVAFICAAVGIFLSSKKTFPIAGVILCFLLIMPLLGIQLQYWAPTPNNTFDYRSVL